MDKRESLRNYLVYLNFLNSKLQKFFEAQKPYIFCKKGCGKCCRNAQFPYSEVEIRYLLYGFTQLSPEMQRKVEENIFKVKKQKEEFKGDKFYYDCPFLINDECCVYEYRGIICRAFGLNAVGSDGRFKAPFCAFEGLNYSNVIDIEKGIISSEKYKESKIEVEPLVYNVSYHFLTDEDSEKAFKFEFGEKKQLIDWL